jgi:hypothetical protein
VGSPLRMEQPLGPPRDGRNETPLERCDRNLAELMQEVRVAQTGVQVLFGFLLTVPFTVRFDDITDTERAVYFVTLMLAGLAAMLLTRRPAITGCCFAAATRSGW